MSPTLITALVLRVWAVCLTTPVFSIGRVVPLAGCNDEQLRPIQVWARLGNTIKFLVKTYVVFCAWVCSGCAYWAFSNKRGGLFSPLHLAVHLDIYLSDWHIELIMAQLYVVKTVPFSQRSTVLIGVYFFLAYCSIVSGSCTLLNKLRWKPIVVKQSKQKQLMRTAGVRTSTLFHLCIEVHLNA